MLLSFLPFLFSAMQGFTSGCIRFDLIRTTCTWMNYRIPWRHYRWIRHHILFSITDFAILLLFVVLCIQKNCFCHFQGLFVIIKEIFFKIPGQFKYNLHFFRIPGVFQDLGHFPGHFKVCVNPDSKYNVSIILIISYLSHGLLPMLPHEQRHLLSLHKYRPNHEIMEWIRK